MKTHVFVAALSTFPAANANGETVMRETAYQFEDKSLAENAVYTCRGHYQLEPIPVFIEEKLEETITDFVLLETRDVREKDVRASVTPAPDGSAGPWQGTAAAWYAEWLRMRFPDVSEDHIYVIRIDENKPAAALEKTIKQIRKLYRQIETPEDWRLWIDTHGAFRSVSETLATAARMFAVGKRGIPTNGIFTVYYSQRTNAKKGKPAAPSPSRIVNLTPFYFSESAKTLRSFLNYGQYLTLRFEPYEGNGAYAFISYRHDPDFLVAVRSFFAKLEEAQISYWFDDGIRTGEKWAEVLKEKNRRSAAFFGLLTNSYFASPECWKELLYAIAAKKNCRFILLEDRVFLPEGIPAAAKFKGARELQRTLGVTDADIRAALDSSVQQLQFYKYMSGCEETQINGRTPQSDELARDMKKLSGAVRGAGSRSE